jgi:glucosamine-6-phosphate deaminase
MAVPAGRTPRPTYQQLRIETARRRLSFGQAHVFEVDELCAPGPGEGYFWRDVREGLLAWAAIPDSRLHPFDPAAADPDGMCRAVEASITALGGLDLAVLGLGRNGHLAANEPGSPFDSRTRPVRLLPETVAYILTDAAVRPGVGDRAVTLGLGTLAEAREVVVLVSGAGKASILHRALTGPVAPDCPASILQRWPHAVVLTDRAAGVKL